MCSLSATIETVPRAPGPRVEVFTIGRFRVVKQLIEPEDADRDGNGISAQDAIGMVAQMKANSTANNIRAHALAAVPRQDSADVISSLT
mmetsp:Transcript_32084/g.92437  ORF Transcript_32084/g.92437 Transcript_32084/m.92437 type:complete len:89 (-) Transcript_32084:450-716(-)